MSIDINSGAATSGLSLHSAPPHRPTLESGDRLTRAEFERRYRDRPDIKKAELVDGVVYMPSPVRIRQHASPHSHCMTWLGVYESATPGVQSGNNATVRLDADSTPQPDGLLRIAPQFGGQSDTDNDGFVAGAPELIAEITASTVSYDMHAKLQSYRRNGVQEYVVLLVEQGIVMWFRLREGQFVELLADEDGILRSEVFPGLWLDAPAFINGNVSRMLEVVQAGIATPKHAAFVEKLKQAALK